MKITKKLLQGLMPCTTDKRIKDFLECFPKRKITVEGCQEAIEKGFDVEWVLRKLYPDSFGVAYEKTMSPVLEAYEKDAATAWEAYNKAVAQEICRIVTQILEEER